MFWFLFRVEKNKQGGNEEKQTNQRAVCHIVICYKKNKKALLFVLKLHVRRWWQTLLRGFSVKEKCVNFICNRERKACSFKILVSFLNQGHLFLSGKREMFLKARLSIKSIGCYGDYLPHRTALCVQLCDFLYSKVQHCQKTNYFFSCLSQSSLWKRQ